jgi:hypothetical protein
MPDGMLTRVLNDPVLEATPEVIVIGLDLTTREYAEPGCNSCPPITTDDPATVVVPTEACTSRWIPGVAEASGELDELDEPGRSEPLVEVTTTGHSSKALEVCHQRNGYPQFTSEPIPHISSSP